MHTHIYTQVKTHMVPPQTSTHHHRMTSETASVNPEQHGSGLGSLQHQVFPKGREVLRGWCVGVNAHGETVNTYITNKSGVFNGFFFSTNQ